MSSIADTFGYLKSSENTKSLGFVSEMLGKESKCCGTQFRLWQELNIPCEVGAEGSKHLRRDAQLLAVIRTQ